MDSVDESTDSTASAFHAMSISTEVHSSLESHEASNPLPPPILQLSDECFNKLFEYLSLAELSNIGQTCKALQQLAGEYFKQNYNGARAHCGDDCIYITDSNNLGGLTPTIRTTVLNPFITHLSYGLSNRFNKIDTYLQAHIDEFTSLKELTIFYNMIDTDQVECLKKILPQIEVIRLRRCEYGGDLYETLLKYCVNLKAIHVNDDTRTVPIVNKYGNPWLLREYPSVETVELSGRNPFQITEFSEFLAKNPNIRTLTLSAGYLWENKQALLECQNKLETLRVDVLFEGASFNLLNQLYERGFFKQLHFDARNDSELILDEYDYEEIAKLCGLSTISITDYTDDCGLSKITSLKDVTLLSDEEGEFESIAINLGNLQTISLEAVPIESILPFIRYAPKVETIKVRFYKDKALNLELLNEERKQLKDACKVVIFVTSQTFLTTKWTTKHGNINLSLIEMRRKDN